MPSGITSESVASSGPPLALPLASDSPRVIASCTGSNVLNAAYNSGSPMYAVTNAARCARAFPRVANDRRNASSGGANTTHARSLSLPVAHVSGHSDLNTRSFSSSAQIAAIVAGCVSADSHRLRKSILSIAHGKPRARLITAS